jgi:HEPN domain-containing protein
MTNYERGENLLNDAEIYYEEMQRMFEKGKWNIVVRRAQEVVELSLKGILKIMGIEFPKVIMRPHYLLLFSRKKVLNWKRKFLKRFYPSQRYLPKSGLLLFMVKRSI